MKNPKEDFMTLIIHLEFPYSDSQNHKARLLPASTMSLEFSIFFYPHGVFGYSKWKNSFMSKKAIPTSIMHWRLKSMNKKRLWDNITNTKLVESKDSATKEKLLREQSCTNEKLLEQNKKTHVGGNEVASEKWPPNEELKSAGDKKNVSLVSSSTFH